MLKIASLVECRGEYRIAPVAPEGIAVRARAGGLDLCLLSDADDPGLPSCLLRARW
jgi:hypothetical protein